MKAEAVQKKADKRRKRHLLREYDHRYCRARDIEILGGLDEAGRGALAGPVVVGAVVIDMDFRIDGLTDSKKLDVRRRELFYDRILRESRAAAVGWASAREVDMLNVLGATLLAGQRALRALRARPQWLLTDYLHVPECGCEYEALIEGDGKSQAVAAASVLAKVTRDRWMGLLCEEYPEYCFSDHKGYSVPVHIEALQKYGASTIHRHTFRGVDWFDREHRRSRTLTRLMEQHATQKILLEEAEDLWQRDGYFLPEVEWEILKEAIGQ
ncbi:MAG: ribonuclease HII [Candidatus Sumerlaeia bacterium]